MEKKYPPRVFANDDWSEGIDFFEWSRNDTGGPEYLSLIEHQAIVKPLVDRIEKLRAAMMGEAAPLPLDERPNLTVKEALEICVQRMVKVAKALDEDDKAKAALENYRKGNG